jgi:DNA-binding CsgD family transcriptional regulator
VSVAAFEEMWPDEDRRDDALERLGAVVDHADEFLSRNRESRLTPAEVRSVQAISVGLTAVEAAELYGNSRETMNRHLSSVRRALGAKTNAHAAVLALRAGLIA